MVKLTVLYGHPESTEAFEAHYRDVHVPLAKAIPELTRLETARVIADASGGAPPYHRIAHLYFPDLQTLGESMASEQGRAAGADVANFATGGATLFVSDVDED